MEKSTFLIVLAYLLPCVFASPLYEESSNRTALQKRNPCDGINAMPILYHEYGSGDCPPINHLDGNGKCTGYLSTGKQCAAFCQIRKLSKPLQPVR